MPFLSQQRAPLAAATVALVAAMAMPRAAHAESLYDKLGGGSAIARVANYLVDYMASSSIIYNNAPFGKEFAAHPVPWLKYQITSFLCELTGGPQRYVGPAPALVFEKAALSDKDWEEVLNILMRGLDTNAIPIASRFELVQRLGELHDNPDGWRPAGAAPLAPAKPVRGDETTAAATIATKRYTNELAALDAHLHEHFTAFRCDYPATWTLSPTEGKTPESIGFAEMANELDAGEDGTFTLEKVSFGPFWFESPITNQEMSTALSATLVENLQEQFEAGFPGYKKLSEGTMQAGDYSGYGFEWSSHIPGTAKGDIDLWGRIILIAPGTGGETHGLAVTVIGTNLQPELKGIEDLGKRGQLPAILSSLHVGK